MNIDNLNDKQKEAVINTEGLEAVVMTDAKWLEFMLGQLMANSLINLWYQRWYYHLHGFNGLPSYSW